ncbi:hypothetical protein JCGZ_10432 [Jatropha curcas]|uniref:Uncharacterized protein n=1 Tax=Jatropha curcas TaxID=180498 RepID=A0A067KHW2_JATCU|nr:hypothetical protein JCGZ_10432 [Jatropha curcas]
METVTNNLIVQTSSLQLPPTYKQYLTDKIDNLVEIYHIPESTQIQNSFVPILNHYAVFKRSPSLSRQLRQIISRPSINIKEYVQSSSLYQCVLSSTPAEQYVTLETPEQFITQWKGQKYTHLHFGAIRLVLSYHGRQGLPVIACLSLLDTRYLQYEHAVIGTVATSLNAGSVVLTFLPNFNMSLEDPHLGTALKVQVQITGAEQVPEHITATLHHQIVYRLQDHAINLQTPGISHSDALYIFADGGPTPIIVQTPRQLPREELEKLIPSTWIINYEKLHQLPQPIQQQDPIFVRQLDKSVRISFLPSSSEPRHSISMIQPAKSKPLKHAPIHSFAHTVTITKLDSQPLRRKTQSCRPSTQNRPFDDDDAPPPPWVGIPKNKNKPITEDEYLKRCFEILAEEGLLQYPPPPTICFCSLEAYQTPSTPTAPLACCMMHPEDFPPLETIHDSTARVTASPYVRQTVIHSNGNLQPLSPSKEVLNWQTSNAVVQNQYLKKIDVKLNQALKKNDHLTSTVSSFCQEAQQMHSDLVQKISKLDKELNFLIETNPSSPLFYEKEKEIRQLRRQVEQIEKDKILQSPASPPSLPFPYTLPSPLFRACSYCR